MKLPRIALIGCGAIGQAVLAGLALDEAAQLGQIVVRDPGLPALRTAVAGLAPVARLVDAIDWAAADAPELIIECAGHSAVDAHLIDALRRGVPAVLVSIGSLHDADLLSRLADAATQGGTQVHLGAGAVGGSDALAAAKLGWRERVHYSLTEEDRQKLVLALSWLYKSKFVAGAVEVQPGVKGATLARTVDEALAQIPEDLPATRFLHMHASHPMGTARMTTDPAAGVVDPTGKVFDTTHLYVMDAAIFPSSLGVNPQMTIMAMASHLSELLASGKP